VDFSLSEKNMENKIKEKIYKLELEIIELRDEFQPQRMAKTAKKSLRKMILNKIDGKMGEC
jgi:hypothetical protein